MAKNKRKNQKYIKKKVFTSPGTLEYVGKEVSTYPKINLITFNESFYQEKLIQEWHESKPQIVPQKTTWLDVDGIHEINVIENIGKIYHLHPLLLEDILNTEQKPKIEHFGDNHVFLVLKMLRFDEEIAEIESEHVALVLGENHVISFQEIHKTDVFLPIYERLKSSIGKTRRGKSDYLFYSLCDLIVDNYFIVLEKFSEKVEEIEVKIIENPQTSDQTILYQLKRELLSIRKVVQPLRDIFNSLVREDSPLINETTKLYFRDVYDHVLQILDAIEIHREMLENIQNIYLTNISNKMNSVMKTLTVFTAIFMPLSFIAGIYGMNFDNMPELHHPNGYFYTLAGMFVLGISLWFYFKWKKYV
jgi:magnesium transporter